MRRIIIILVGWFIAEDRLPFSCLSNAREKLAASSSHGTRFQDGEFNCVLSRRTSKSTVIRRYRSLFKDSQILIRHTTPYSVETGHNFLHISRRYWHIDGLKSALTGRCCDRSKLTSLGGFGLFFVLYFWSAQNRFWVILIGFYSL